MLPLPPSGEVRPPRRRRKDARPQELTAAALALFVERGYAATRLDDVAAAAGVSKGTLYLYFESKEMLFRAVIEEGMVPAIVAGEALLEQYPDDPERLLRCILFGWWDLVGTTRLGGIAKLMVAEARNFPEVARYYHDNVIRRGLALIRSALQRGVARGTFRPVDLENAPAVLIAPIFHLILWRHSIGACCGQVLDERAYLETHFDLVIKGLCVDSSDRGVIR